MGTRATRNRTLDPVRVTFHPGENAHPIDLPFVGPDVPPVLHRRKPYEGKPMPDFSSLDYVAFVWFAVCWLGYTGLADHSRLSKSGVSAAMNAYRLQWMNEMLRRDVRIVDSTILSNLMTGIGFFASTSMLVIGGLLAVLGAVEQALNAFAELPFAVQTSRAVWEIKLTLMILIFVYAFFKFAWSFRLSNYCSILIGAAPNEPQDETSATEYAERAAHVTNILAQHFNRGLRAYMFALAALAWLVHPVAFIVATTWVFLVLYRREFRSRTLHALKSGV